MGGTTSSHSVVGSFRNLVTCEKTYLLMRRITWVNYFTGGAGKCAICNKIIYFDPGKCFDPDDIYVPLRAKNENREYLVPICIKCDSDVLKTEFTYFGDEKDLASLAEVQKQCVDITYCNKHREIPGPRGPIGSQGQDINGSKIIATCPGVDTMSGITGPFVSNGTTAIMTTITIPSDGSGSTGSEFGKPNDGAAPPPTVPIATVQPSIYSHAHALQGVNDFG
jgi:hypothetical protein